MGFSCTTKHLPVVSVDSELLEKTPSHQLPSFLSLALFAQDGWVPAPKTPPQKKDALSLVPDQPYPQLSGFQLGPGKKDHLWKVQQINLKFKKITEYSPVLGRDIY